MQSVKCIYHSADFDGKCSAAIIKLTVPQTVLIPANYGQKFDWDQISREDVVYLVDFALQPYNECMPRLIEKCKRLIWIDHHITSIKWCAEAEIDKNDKVHTLMDATKAACELCWEFCHPTKQIPTSVHLLGRYDVWDHKDNRVLSFQSGMRYHGFNLNNMEVWDRLFKDEFWVEEIYTIGDTLNEFEKQNSIRLCKRAAYELEWLDRLWIAMNAPSRGSLVFDSIYDKEEHDGMISYFWNGRHWEVSLYSETMDVAALAAQHGGGGHKGAAGFICKALPFSSSEVWK